MKVKPVSPTIKGLKQRCRRYPWTRARMARGVTTQTKTSWVLSSIPDRSVGIKNKSMGTTRQWTIHSPERKIPARSRVELKATGPAQDW